MQNATCVSHSGVPADGSALHVAVETLQLVLHYCTNGKLGARIAVTFCTMSRRKFSAQANTFSMFSMFFLRLQNSSSNSERLHK